jgi:hypothetical protein
MAILAGVSVRVFGWLDRLLARRADKQFASEIRTNMVLLFAKHGAEVVANDESEQKQPRSFDYAVAKVAAPDLLLRFVRVRGQFEIEIGLPGLPTKWESMDSALCWLDLQEGNIKPTASDTNWGYGFEPTSLDWGAVDRFLDSYWERLKIAATSPGTLRK